MVVIRSVGWLTARRGRSAALRTGLACSLMLVVPRAGHAQCEYEATPIQPRPCPIFGILPAQPRGLSSNGHVAGWYQDCSLVDDIAYYWTPEVGVVDIPFPAGSLHPHAEDINGTGRIVGSVDLPDDGLQQLAFVYESQNGSLTNLGTIERGNASEAVRVNEAGQVAGTAWNFITGDPPFTPFLWEDGVVTFMTVPFGPNAMVRDISDNGQIVGWMGDSSTIDSHAFIWHDGIVDDLGLAPGTFSSTAAAINNLGQVLVVGNMQQDETSPVLTRSFLWDDGVWTDLGVVPGYDRCAGRDLNDAGQVVGQCTQSATNFSAAFLWQDGVISDLNDLTITETAAGLPYRINDLGQIASVGGIGSPTVDPAVLLLEPIDQSPGDLDHNCVVGIDDFLMLLEAWGQCPAIGPCVGDVDGDGVVGIIDFLTLLANWSF